MGGMGGGPVSYLDCLHYERMPLPIPIPVVPSVHHMSQQQQMHMSQQQPHQYQPQQHHQPQHFHHHYQQSEEEVEPAYATGTD